MYGIICRHCGKKNNIGGSKVPGRSQKARLAHVLSDLRPHSTYELIRKVYGVNVATVARLASRVNDLRNEGWYIMSRQSKKNPAKWWYSAVHTDKFQCAMSYEILQDEEDIIRDYDNKAGMYQ